MARNNNIELEIVPNMMNKGKWILQKLQGKLQELLSTPLVQDLENNGWIWLLIWSRNKKTELPSLIHAGRATAGLDPTRAPWKVCADSSVRFFVPASTCSPCWLLDPHFARVWPTFDPLSSIFSPIVQLLIIPTHNTNPTWLLAHSNPF